MAAAAIRDYAVDWARSHHGDIGARAYRGVADYFGGSIARGMGRNINPNYFTNATANSTRVNSTRAIQQNSVLRSPYMARGYGRKRARVMPYSRRPFKRPRRITGSSRAIYGTVPRTRGIYASGELKYFDSKRALLTVDVSDNWTATEIDPATLNTIFLPAQGAGINQRIGLSAVLRKIKIRGTFIASSKVNQNSGTNACTCRVILYQDTQTNATQAQGEDLMQNLSAAAENVFSFQNIANFGRFKVLKDKTFNLENQNMVWDGTNIEENGIQKHFKLTVNFKQPVVVRFNGTAGGTIADIIDNSFHMLAIASDSTLDTNIFYTCRCTYTG